MHNCQRQWLLVLLCSFYGLQLIAKPLELSVNAESAILINADTGAVLYEKNAHTLQYPASITKIATAAYTLLTHPHDLDVMVAADSESLVSIGSDAKRRANYTNPPYWQEHDGMHVGIKKGEQLSLRNLLNASLIASANDASNTIAQYVGEGSIPNFMQQVNIWLNDIGCKNTHFCNPHGLHHPKHQTTAFDMALMTRYALKFPEFCEIIKSLRFIRPKTSIQESATYVQTNKLLRQGPFYYPKAIGVKIGYHSHALHTFVAAAKQGDRTLIAVLLKSKERNDLFRDAKKMFEAAFSEPKVQRVFLKTGPQKFKMEIAGASAPIKTYIRDPLSVEYYPAEEPKLKCLLFWDSITPPVGKDQRLGELRLETDDGRVIQNVPLYASEDVPTTWLFGMKSMLKKGEGTSSLFKILGICAAFLLIGALAFQMRKPGR
jgi:serine-type D-Ala-D-Ala carboxypeptidase (penicillin-binding protein 5/6)